MDEHLGYSKHAVEGRNHGNSRNGTRSKTVLTEIGPVDIDVPRDRDSSFDPQTVRKQQRRLDGVDSMVISLTAKGLTTGEVEGLASPETPVHPFVGSPPMRSRRLRLGGAGREPTAGRRRLRSRRPRSARGAPDERPVRPP